jgi:cysteine protease ATG4
MKDDIGWGCMARTGQMMLCQTLCQVMQKYKNDIIPYFFDTPDASFSIHKITEYGEKLHIPVGNWFNPTGIACTIKNLVLDNNNINHLLHVIIGKDGCIYEDEILDALNSEKQVLILIPTMLGLEKINESYYTPLLKCFETKYNVGVLGGKPKKSFYFIGKQKNNILYLDPHHVKPALLSINESENKISFHNIFNLKETFSKRFLYDDDDQLFNNIDIEELDPCMLICFLLKNKDDFKRWKEYIEKNININRDISLFSVMDKKKIYEMKNNGVYYNKTDGEWDEI